ncbi:MAG: preprotein translocase subunit SecG [Ruminococcus sp.]|nr:preprotein translocase subunit SecG [Ruminococcus sp.]
MEIMEIIGGAVLLIACIAIIVLCLMQESKSQDSLTNALTGASSDSFYGKNEGRSREAVLARITKTAGILFFVITLAVNIIPIFTDK